MTGATLQMVSHGLVTGLLFAMVGLVYEKTHERSIPKLGGLARQMPIIVVVFSVAGLAALGLPGTSGFAAEFLIFLGSFNSTVVPGIEVYTIVGILGVVLGAGYILWMLKRVFYGPPKEQYDGVPDANRLEMVYIFALVAMIMLIGIYPALVTDLIKIGVSPILAALGL
jgi:NADH-quinone oxidoreductase subunit M